MSRPLRILYDNAYYHVMNRGAGRQMNFHDETDYQVFLRICRGIKYARGKAVKEKGFGQAAWEAYSKKRGDLKGITDKFYHINRKNYSYYTSKMKAFINFDATCGTDSTVRLSLPIEPISGLSGMKKLLPE